MSVTGADIEAALAADGWPFERLDDRTWRSGFQAPGQDKVRFFVRLTDDWLCLTIDPFAVVPGRDSVALPFMRHLLKLNRSMTLAKFAIDQQRLILTVELTVRDLTADQIKDGLDALSFYTVHHRAEVTELASARPVD